jgi:hypothetical protein
MVEDLYPWLVIAHILGALVFAMAHGVNLFVAFRVRRELDKDRIRAYLELSGASITMTYAGLLVVLVTGILAGVAHGWFAFAWTWLSIAVLVGLSVLMFVRGSGYYTEIRHAVGLRSFLDKPDAPLPQPLPPDALARLLESRRPEELTVTGGLGLGVLVSLMVIKPF